MHDPLDSATAVAVTVRVTGTARHRSRRTCTTWRVSIKLGSLEGAITTSAVNALNLSPTEARLHLDTKLRGSILGVIATQNLPCIDDALELALRRAVTERTGFEMVVHFAKEAFGTVRIRRFLIRNDASLVRATAW